jgi:CubicO group peptidase (beta-lactamase class C family)
MARLGLVMVRHGRWKGQKVVPQAWVHTSTSVKVSSSDLTGLFKGRPLGYGYLWWLPEARSSNEDWAHSFLAAGNYGQFILGLPQPEIVEKLNRAVNAALTDPKVQTRLAKLGGEPMPMTPPEFGKLVAVETEKWGKVIRVAGITAK